MADLFNPGRAAGIRDAAEVAKASLWKHGGDDAYSAGMDAGARHQNAQDVSAILALLDSAPAPAEYSINPADLTLLPDLQRICDAASGADRGGGAVRQGDILGDIKRRVDPARFDFTRVEGRADFDDALRAEIRKIDDETLRAHVGEMCKEWRWSILRELDASKRELRG